MTKPKAQIEHEELLCLRQQSESVGEQPDSPAASDATGFPWETIGLAALGGGVLAAGGVAVARRFHHEPGRA